MQRHSFSTFKEAANFAKQHAQKVGATLKLEREGEEWAVYPNQRTASTASDKKENLLPTESASQHQEEKDQWQIYCKKERERREQEKKNREVEEKRRKEEIRIREERQAYLKKRGNFYRSRSKKELENIWSKRHKKNLEPDELDLIKNILREAKGIKPAYRHSVRVCPRCGMVGGNCICKAP